MPATPSRIGFITQPYRIATAGPDSRVVSLYGSKARDTTEALPTFFDNQADALVMAQERLELLAAERRLVVMNLGEVETSLGLAYTQTLPVAAAIDDEDDLDRDMLVVGIQFDFDKRRAQLTLWG